MYYNIFLVSVHGAQNDASWNLSEFLLTCKNESKLCQNQELGIFDNSLEGPLPIDDCIPYIIGTDAIILIVNIDIIYHYKPVAIINKCTVYLFRKINRTGNEHSDICFSSLLIKPFQAVSSKWFELFRTDMMYGLLTSMSGTINITQVFQQGWDLTAAL